jgi:death-on-curing protein
MRYLIVEEALRLHEQLLAQTGGAPGVRDSNALDSALAQPRMTFGGNDLYPTPWDKAAALGFSLIKNHPFVDGNKRAGHAAMETFLVLNGSEIAASTDEQEDLILGVASGKIGREELTEWVRSHVVGLGSLGEGRP